MGRTIRIYGAAIPGGKFAHPHAHAGRRGKVHAKKIHHAKKLAHHHKKKATGPHMTFEQAMHQAGLSL